MNKKLFLRLCLILTVLLSLYSCIHDEIISSSDLSSTEYTNKSLWKQDEKYITNVMKVYAKNEAEIKKENGIPYWNYATTVDSFDESFVAIPIIDDGKVTAVLKVPRHGKKIYFYYTHEESDLMFFQGLVFAKNKKAGMMDGSTAQTNGMACTRQWISVWLPDSESNPDGAGHWSSTSIIKCESTKDECIGIALPNGDCDLSGGTDGGYPYPGGGGEGNEQEEEEKTPCEKAAENNLKAKELLNNAKISIAEGQLTSTLSSDTNEKSFSFGKDATGNYDTTPINTATAGNQVGLQASNPNLTIEGGAHTHTVDLYNCFSAGDIYSLQGANAINSNFKTFFVFANGNVAYAMTITDPDKYAAFVASYTAGSNLDMGTSYWKPTSQIYTDSENIKRRFLKQGLSEDAAFANAVAYVLNKYDTGATLSQRDSSGNFNSIFVEENVIPVNVGGVSIPVSVYNQTTTCNL